MIPLGEKAVKLGHIDEGAIFQIFSLGVATNRDDWVYDFDNANLSKKVKFFCDHFEKAKAVYRKLKDVSEFKDTTIKFTSEILDHFRRNSALVFHKDLRRYAAHRPFIKIWTYYDKIITHRLYQQNNIFSVGSNAKNKLICFNNMGKDFRVLATDLLPDLHFIGDAQCLPLYRYDEEGRQDNITDWALTEFRENYKDKKIKKEDIFHYVYGVLHDPEYRAKYELNLKREFPRVPFYKDFWQWANWGAGLMEMHIGYETVKPYALTKNTVGDDTDPKAKLRADKDEGLILLDANTTLSGVPQQAWDYKLGNRSALEWILDQYKEKKPSDPTIAEKFNNYRFADYKEHVIDLLKRVCTVSTETMKIVEAMKVAGKHFR